MKHLLIRLCTLCALAGLIVSGCGDGSNSPSAPDNNRSIQLQNQSSCGEDTFLASLSPVLAVWEDSIETWRGAGDILNPAPAWTDVSTVGGHLSTLVPVLQQWEAAINGSLGSAVLDTVANFNVTTSHRQNYLTGLSTLLASWKADLETARGTTFLATPPAFLPDTVAPELVCFGDTTITCADSLGAVVTFTSSAVDDCDPAPVVTCEPPSGTLFPLGETVVTCTAVDSLGNESTCSFLVTVEAAAAPVITDVTASPAILWPPNHKWVDIHIGIEAESSCEAEPECEIIEVTSNESDNGTGDGNTSPDWMITGDNTLKLRAERSGSGSGRIYTIRVRCGDESEGDERTVTVTVPHDKSGKH